METQVIMKRKLFGADIAQQSKTTFFSAKDLVAAGNKYRVANDMPMFIMGEWFRKDSTVEFMRALEAKFGTVKVAGRGKGANTWVHPLLFIDMALAISPKLKIEVYTWLYDYLLEYRNNSGDSYKKMCGALYLRISNKSKFKDCIVSTANRIQKACGVADWQKATQEQLKLRDTIHNNIALLTDVMSDVNQAIRMGITKAVRR
jgi:hypothetical protein